MLLCLLVFIVCVFRYKTQKLNWRRRIWQLSINRQESRSDDTVIAPETADMSQKLSKVSLVSTDAWEFSREQLFVKKDCLLGHGAFGQVFKGTIEFGFPNRFQFGTNLNIPWTNTTISDRVQFSLDSYLFCSTAKRCSWYSRFYTLILRLYQRQSTNRIDLQIGLFLARVWKLWSCSEDPASASGDQIQRRVPQRNQCRS